MSVSALPALSHFDFDKGSKCVSRLCQNAIELMTFRLSFSLLPAFQLMF